MNKNNPQNTRKDMKKKIVVGYGEHAHIAKLMGCTPDMVSKSLRFEKNSLLARRIRKVAVELGGVEVEYGRRAAV